MDTILSNVDYILKWHPETRDNDDRLIVMVWTIKYGVVLVTDTLNPNVASAGSILRMRRMLKEKYPPNNNEPRMRKEAEMRVFLKGDRNV